MSSTYDEKQIARLMHLLNCPRDEAIQVIEDDKRIDRGEKLFELTAEQKQNAKAARAGAKQPTTYTFTQRERKADTDKRTIIDLLTEALAQQEIAVSVTNAEREIEFEYKGRKMRLTLSLPRK